MDHEPASPSLSISAPGDIRISGDVVGRDKVVHGYTAEQVQGLMARLATDYQPRPFDGRCPYPGLESFSEGDAALFFGREGLVRDLVQRLDHASAVLLVGPSGSGKSSLVRAGLIPALKAGGLPGSARWRAATLTPGRAPLAALGRALPLLTGSLDSGADLIGNAGDDPTRLTRWLQAGTASDPLLRAVLVVDQFEEVFTQTTLESERLAFITQLCVAADQATESCRLVLVMRSDFVGDCARYPALNALLNGSLVQVGALSPDELVRAVVLPALQVGLRIDPDLVTQILADVRAEPGALPLLQFALRDLFDAERGLDGVPALTLAAYLRRGGLHQALRRHADAVLATLSDEQLALTRGIFRGLVSVGAEAGAPLTRRTANLTELAAHDPASAALVQRLADARLVTVADGDGEGASPAGRSVTLAHERLLEAWPWLAELVAVGRDSIRLRAALLDDAGAWSRHHREDSYLYRGARLAIARQQAADLDLPLPAEAAAFLEQAVAREARAAAAIEAARQAELDKERATSRQLRTRSRIIAAVAVLAGALAVLALGAGIVAALSSLNASRAAATAQAANTQTVAQSWAALARSGALQATALLAQGESARGFQVAAEAARFGLRVSPQGVPDVNAALYAAYLQDSSLVHELGVYPAGAGGLTNVRVVVAADLLQVAALTTDGRAELWWMSGERQAAAELVAGQFTSASFSLPGRALLAGLDVDQKVVLMDQDGQNVLTLPTTTFDPPQLHPDGAWVLTYSAGGARLWTTLGEARAELVPANGAGITTAFFSPGGDEVVLLEAPDRLEIFALDGRSRFYFAAQNGVLEQVTLSPDGSWLAYGDADGVKIITRSDNRLVSLPVTLTTALPPGHLSPVSALAITPDGQQLAVGLGDGRILIVSNTGQLLRTLNGHSAAITDLDLSADSQVLLSGSSSPDGTARLWRLDGTALAVFPPSQALLNVQQVALSASLQGHSAGPIVVVPDFGNPRVWTLYPTLEDTLAAVDRRTAARLDAAGCVVYFGQPCVP